MKKKELQEAKNKTKEELVKAIGEKKAQIALLRVELKMGKHGNLRVVKNVRREVAQLETILNRKERAEK